MMIQLKRLLFLIILSSVGLTWNQAYASRCSKWTGMKKLSLQKHHDLASQSKRNGLIGPLSHDLSNGLAPRFQPTSFDQLPWYQNNLMRLKGRTIY